MKPGQYMNDYNYHDWVQFMVRVPKDRPKSPHFAAVLFGTRTDWTPGYDSGESGTSSTVPEIHYFAFPDKSTLNEWVLRAAKDKKEFFFFEVRRVGEVELRVNIDMDL